MPPDQPYNVDACLVMRAKSGDSMAIKQLLYHVSSPLREVIESKLPNEYRRVVSTDDVFQETAIAVQLRISSLTSNCPNFFWAWAEKVAENKLQAIVRAERAKKRHAWW